MCVDWFTSHYLLLVINFAVHLNLQLGQLLEIAGELLYVTVWQERDSLSAISKLLYRLSFRLFSLNSPQRLQNGVHEAGVAQIS